VRVTSAQRHTAGPGALFIRTIATAMSLTSAADYILMCEAAS